MKKAIRYFVFLPFLFSACGKSGVTLHGKVIDKNTGAVIPDTRVNVNIKWEDRFSGSTTNGAFATGTGDADGNYVVMIDDREKKREAYKIYMATVYCDAWQYIEGTSFSPDYAKRDDVQHDIELNGIGHAYIIVHNTNPFDANDRIGDFYWSATGDITNAPEFIGTNVNDTFMLVAHSGKRALHYSITKNGGTSSFHDSINVPGFADVYYHLNY